MKVFSYGTLRVGDIRHGVGSFIKVVAQEAYLEGFDMLDLGGFPGLVEGSRRIRGEVHEYENLDVLDLIEGYHVSEPRMGLYNRIQVTVSSPKGDIEDCWVYLFNDTPSFQREKEVIACGDWFEYRDYYKKLRIEA